MRLLIVDDDHSLAELTAELLLWLDQPAGHIETISLAGDLDTAIRRLPGYDAVLCDGHFPLSADGGSQGDEWHGVYREALVCGIPFILYSGCPRSIEDAKLSGIPVIAKPATIERIYEVLTELWAEVRPAVVSGNSGH